MGKSLKDLTRLKPEKSAARNSATGVFQSVWSLKGHTTVTNFVFIGEMKLEIRKEESDLQTAH